MAFCYLRVVSYGLARVILPEPILDRSVPKDKKWINDHYKDKGYDCSDLSHFFSTTGTGTEIDSGAVAIPTSMAATVAAALKSSGLDADNIIWRFEKAKGGWNTCQGKGCTGTMLITIANKSDTTDKKDGDLIEVSQYKLKVTYGDDGTITQKELSKTSTTTAKLVDKVNKENHYWVLGTS